VSQSTRRAWLPTSLDFHLNTEFHDSFSTSNPCSFQCRGWKPSLIGWPHSSARIARRFGRCSSQPPGRGVHDYNGALESETRDYRTARVALFNDVILRAAMKSGA
jgi:hypothetical protein